jgi:hypothetical protein
MSRGRRAASRDRTSHGQNAGARGRARRRQVIRAARLIGNQRVFGQANLRHKVAGVGQVGLIASASHLRRKVGGSMPKGFYAVRTTLRVLSRALGTRVRPVRAASNRAADAGGARSGSRERRAARELSSSSRAYGGGYAPAHSHASRAGPWVRAHRGRAYQGRRTDGVRRPALVCIQRARRRAPGRVSLREDYARTTSC